MVPSDVQHWALVTRDVVLVVLLIAASWTDTRTAKILNVHTFPAMGLGVLLSGIGLGEVGLLASALGILAAFVVMFPMFALNIMRAGDAKMLMAIGALLGGWIALRALLISCFLFIPVAIVVLLARGQLSQVWGALKAFWRFFYTTFHPLLKSEPLGSENAVMTPFGLVLAIATVIAWKSNFLMMDLGAG